MTDAVIAMNAATVALNTSIATYGVQHTRVETALSGIDDKKDELTASAATAVTDAVASIARNIHKFYVNPDANIVIANGTSENPFKYVRDALLVAPLGGRVEIEVPNGVDFWFSDPANTNHLNTHFHASFLTIRTKVTDGSSKSTMKFATAASGDNTQVSGLGMNGVLHFIGVKVESPDLINPAGSGEVCIENIGSLKLITFVSGFIVGDNPIIGSNIYGDIEHCISGFEFTKNPNAVKTVIHTANSQSRLHMNAYYAITIEGEIGDYFKTGSSGFVTWNKNDVTGNQ